MGPSRYLRAAGLLVVALLLAVTAGFGTRTPAQAAPQPDTAQVAAAASVHGCSYYNLCLYTGYNYSGTMHHLYNCEPYYTPYAFHSVVNNQTPGTRGRFYNSAHGLIWTSPGALWYSGNVDGIAGGLGNRSWYVKPC
jgi:hypothetical protein